MAASPSPPGPVVRLGSAWVTPKRMILFFGPQVAQPWSDHAVDQIAIGGEAPAALQASGACTYAEASPGLLVTCDDPR
jgi:hypothetical protein